MKQQHQQRNIHFVLFRLVLLDLPLLLLLLLLTLCLVFALTLYGVVIRWIPNHNYHHFNYGLVTGRRLLWQTQEQFPTTITNTTTQPWLQNQVTYYERNCTAMDVTMHHHHVVDDLIINMSIGTTCTNNVTNTTATITNQSSVDEVVVEVMIDQAMDFMMTHGVIIIPNILPQNQLLRDLRQYMVVERNFSLSSQQSQPTQQQQQQQQHVVTTLDATESEIVARVMEHVANHRMLQQLMEELVGSTDPALIEMYVMMITTSHYYQPQQQQQQQQQLTIPTWQHEGNKNSAMMYARTFRPTYSLFIPLQDTTSQAMGAAIIEVCPGTHYCNNDMSLICNAHKVSLSSISTINSNHSNDNRVWKAGDAVLLNRQVWHRSSASHTDTDSSSSSSSLPQQQQQMVLVLSFVARPPSTNVDFNDDDPPRRFVPPPPLSSSAHDLFTAAAASTMKWNMWGHTWRDLKDAHYSMIQPFSILRSLGLWKPPDRPWGYDYMTTIWFGWWWNFANRDHIAAVELQWFVDNIMDKILYYYPRWLQGPIPPTTLTTIDDDHSNSRNDDDAWMLYIRGTLHNTLLLLAIINMVSLMVYFLVSFIVIKCCCGGGNRSIMTTILRRLLFMYAWIMVVTLFGTNQFQKSHWFQSMHHLFLTTNNNPLRPITVQPQRHFANTVVDPTTFTIPNREDVLMGTRLDAPFLGAYNRWFDYHPGNKEFLLQVKYDAWTYQSYRGLPQEFQEVILINTIRHITDRKNRFLQQDPWTGRWNVMSDVEARQYSHLELLTYRNTRLGCLLRTLRILTDYYRFGRFRETVLSQISLSYLSNLERRILPNVPFSPTRPNVASPPSFHRPWDILKASSQKEQTSTSVME